jgi:branched-chain amino acid aminotransferase
VRAADDGVFEAIKVVGGLPFALERHLARLDDSATSLGLEPVDRAELRREVAVALETNPLAFGRIRVTYAGGTAPVVATNPMQPWPPTTTVVTAPWPRNERGALAGHKATSYADNVLALADARSRGASEAVFANLAGHLCEGTGSNVFYVVDGELRTPSLASGCLGGITRSLVLEWYGAREVDEPIEVAAAASEVFLVSTTRDVHPVVRWDDRELAAPGPVTADVRDVWKRREPELLGV